MLFCSCSNWIMTIIPRNCMWNSAKEFKPFPCHQKWQLVVKSFDQDKEMLWIGKSESKCMYRWTTYAPICRCTCTFNMQLHHILTPLVSILAQSLSRVNLFDISLPLVQILNHQQVLRRVGYIDVIVFLNFITLNGQSWLLNAKKYFHFSDIQKHVHK